VAVPVGQWTKVADAAVTGQVHRLKNGPTLLETHRLAGAGPPGPSTLEGVLVLEETDSVPISFDVAHDVYMWALGTHGQGEVRVDL
jgi:hypothetical protein